MLKLENPSSLSTIKHLANKANNVDEEDLSSFFALYSSIDPFSTKSLAVGVNVNNDNPSLVIGVSGHLKLSLFQIDHLAILGGTL
jgi:hypothetical protein